MTNEELDKARAEEAIRIHEEGDLRLTFRGIAITAARLAREGWMPPEPVDPDVLFVREVLVKRLGADGDFKSAESVRSGRYDYTPAMLDALAVLRAERERVAKLEPKDSDGDLVPNAMTRLDLSGPMSPWNVQRPEPKADDDG